MKHTLILWVLLACLSWQVLPAQTPLKKQDVATKIHHVLAFVSGAQVTRKATVPLTAGKTELVFSGISPNIEKQSIQVKGEGKFTILSVIHQLNHLKEQVRREEITKLEIQKRSLSQRAILERNMLVVYKQEETMLLKNQAIGGQNTGVKATDLREAVDFQRKRLAETLLEQMRIEQNLAQIDSATRKLDAQMIALNKREGLSTSEILVTVSAENALNAPFEVSYLVRDAGWFATYDLRVQDVASPIDLTFKANIRQSSGEDWKDVKLSISNGNPNEGGTSPLLTPWLLRYNTPYASPKANNALESTALIGSVTDSETGEAMIGVAVMLKGTTIGTMTDTNGDFKFPTYPAGEVLVFQYLGYKTKEFVVSSQVMQVEIEQDNATLSEVVVTGYADGLKNERAKKSKVKRKTAQDKKGSDGDREADERFVGGLKYKEEEKTVALEVSSKNQSTTVVFDIEMPYTILNDGKIYTVDIKRHSLPADYTYYAVPKLDKDAFLTAQITNWQDYNLMNGELNLFLEGAFLGKSILDLRKASDTLNISLGRDKGISIERKSLKEYTSKQLLSNFRTESRAYQITVRNNKNLPVKLVLQDHFPMTSDKDITIDNKEAKEAEIDNNTNIITWKLNLASRSEKKLTYKYSVKYPKRQILILD